MGSDGQDISAARHGRNSRLTRFAGGLRLCFRSAACWAALVMIFCVASSAFLIQNVLLDLERHRSAIEDRVLWNIGQAEVELGALEAALADAQLYPQTGDLDRVKRAFDIFYSRIKIIEEGAAYKDLRESAEFDANLAAIRAFLDRNVAKIDGPDDQLQGALDSLHVDVNAIRSTVRQIVLHTVSLRTQFADSIRSTLVTTLIQLGALGALLIVVLVLSTLFVLRLSRSAELRAQRIGETKSRIEAILTRTSGAVITVSQDGIVTDFNRAAERMFGIAAADALDRHIADVAIDEDLKTAIRRVKQSAAGSDITLAANLSEQITQARRKDGQLFPVKASISVLKSEAGRMVLVWISDITERLQREQALKEALESALAGENTKARMLSLMSHEIRTPLNGLIGALQVLGETRLTDRQQKIIGTMQTSCDILMSHVNSVLDISRIDAKGIETTQEPFNVENVAREVYENQVHAAHLAGNTLVVENMIAGEPTYLGDARMIRQTLINLVSNAIKFTHGGVIHIRSTEGADGGFEIAVQDTGIGIAPENLARIFDDFVTIDGRYERSAGGTGLGLGLSRRLAEMMGGSLTVSSTLGKGSTFLLSLPGAARTSAPVAAPQGAEEATPPSRPLRILVAEDNLINLEILTELLVADGHHVTAARDGQEAVRLARREAFDMILMDISMPVMNGADATREIRGAPGPCSAVPIVAVTAYAQASEVEGFLAAGMTAALAKPISRARLRQLLAELTTDSAPAPGIAAIEEENLRDLIEALGIQRISKIASEIDTDLQALVSRMNNPNAAPAERNGLAQDAHKLAGAVAMLGAHRTRDTLVAIESSLKEGCAHDVAATLCRTLREDWRQTSEELDSVLAIAAALAADQNSAPDTIRKAT
ncbi:MAG TPA: ATP-binding protein [Albidovulum sp.]|uniref:ATP-binding protein n=1 Tax=Albidovulum sp. TaxID=1872424 RepID=UPI002C3F8F56|nr:ATP-binding protein [Albidovulum sp.]